jgi:hypothetical protein
VSKKTEEKKMDKLIEDYETIRQKVELRKKLIILQRVHRTLPAEYVEMERGLFAKLKEIDEANQLLDIEHQINIVERFGIWGKNYMMNKNEGAEALPSPKK